MAKFHIKARTVDLLGRQQIAGIPTAISELFKNSHDAYARNVEADYYRDDGLGMTHQESEERWLALGTDSKLGEKVGLKLPLKDATQKERSILGKKGIGRLAHVGRSNRNRRRFRAALLGVPGRRPLGNLCRNIHSFPLLA